MCSLAIKVVGDLEMPAEKTARRHYLIKEWSASCFLAKRERDGLGAGFGAINLINRRANV